ncbi:PucR family transcriptional regulator [Galactobacter valiniphilus]|uniref:PucR family transcriptional regulator n=1 Tax=Galactobacter valiniphilus TaxID=2676122 RepID=A0A399J830_9MICC|nr:PucR family transcriptional regulator [Galactobacter valiniphilus]
MRDAWDKGRARAAAAAAAAGTNRGTTAGAPPGRPAAGRRGETAATPGNDDAAWLGLLALLHENIPSLVDDFMDEVQARSLYAGLPVDHDDIRRTAPQSFATLLSSIADPSADTAAMAQRLGARRAQQGVPLDALTEAVRIDLQLVWRQLNLLASPEQVGLVASRFEHVMRVLDSYVLAVQKAFLSEQAALARDARLGTERELAHLFNAPALSEAELERVAAAMGVATHEPFELAAFSNANAAEARRIAEDALVSGRVFSYAFRDIECLFWLRDTRPDAGRGTRTLPLLGAVPGVLIPASGVSDLPRAAATGRVVLEATPGIDRLRQVPELWAPLAAHALDSAAPGTVSELLSGLGDLEDYERERVLATARAYLETGSVKSAAELVFCHRNTVINRLAVFKAHTGLDLNLPRQAALAVVLLDAPGRPRP